MFKVYKRNKKYHYYFRLNNTVYRGSTKTHSRELANKFAQKIYSEIYLNKNNIKSPKVKISDFIERHLEVKSNTISRDWAYTKAYLLKKFLTYTQENKLNYLSDIELKHLEDYQINLLKTKKPKSAKNEIKVIGSMLNHALKSGYIKENLTKNLDSITIEKNKITNMGKSKQRFLAHNEIKKVLKAVSGTYLENLVLTGLYTGMRRRELIHLEYEDIDFKKKLIYVRNKADFKTKSRKERVVPLHKNLFPLFKKKKSGYCFPYNGNRLIQEDTATRNFTQWCKEAKALNVGLHTLRHTFISYSLMSGVSIWEVGQWVGHSSDYITEQYGHLCPKRREIDKFTI